MKTAIISDVHSNLEALEAVLRDIDKEKADRIISLGDIVGYGANPNEVITLFKKYKIESVKGNHDEAVLNEELLEWFNDHAKNAIKKTRAILNNESKQYLRSLKSFIVDDGIRYVHGCPPDSYMDYLGQDVSDVQAFRNFREKICFVGHTHWTEGIIEKKMEVEKYIIEKRKFIEKTFEHVPIDFGYSFAVRSGERCIYNPGSVGQPRDSPRAKYCIFYEDEKEIEPRAVEYDIYKAATKIREVIGDESLAERLFEGR